jgi:DNA-binding NtrC family response regulator
VETWREEGYDYAAHGAEALAWCGRQVVDVLITDVRLPGGIDGWKISEHSREHDPDLPVIYATGFSPVTPRLVSERLTPQKPYYADDVVRAVSRVLRIEHRGPCSSIDGS